MPQQYPDHIRKIRANIAGLEKWLKIHRRMCPKCRAAHVVRQPSLSCDTGWAFVKDLHREHRQLERQLEPADAARTGQLALW
jgi:hypothetical protein